MLSVARRCNVAAAHPHSLVRQDDRLLIEAADRTETADAQAPLLHAQVSTQDCLDCQLRAGPKLS